MLLADEPPAVALSQGSDAREAKSERSLGRCGLPAILPPATGFVHDSPVTVVFDPTPTERREPDPDDFSSESRLLEDARQGSSPAANALFERYRSWLRKRVRGRLPTWARGALDTSDLVQDALHHTFARLDGFKSSRASVLRVYLRRGVENRIRDEMRRATRRRRAIAPEQPVRASEDGAPQLQLLGDDQAWRRYVDGLKRLKPRERRLIVGRAELGYTYRQLAFIERLSSPDAARMAVKRALVRLSDVFPDS